VASEGCEIHREGNVYFFQEFRSGAGTPIAHLVGRGHNSHRRLFMKIATANFLKATRKASWLLVLCVHLISGCAVLNNSASFYQDQPRRPINWREYTSD
jgi:hypothetical protein